MLRTVQQRERRRMSELVQFPHDPRAARKAAKAGVMTVNDLVFEDNYAIMTKDSAAMVATQVASIYEYDKDTGALEESGRNLHTSDADGNSKMAISLRRNEANVKFMDPVFCSESKKTVISAFDGMSHASATFDKDGLRWDDQSSALYLGGDEFRIQYCPADPDSAQASLRIQAKHPTTGQYVTKLSVVNDTEP